MYRTSSYSNIKNKEFIFNIFLIILFLILPYLFFKNAFLINKFLHGSGDVLTYFYPLRLLMSNIFTNFELPFWNINNFNGFPIISNVQIGIFYIPNILLGYLFSALPAYNISLFLHYSLAGIFMYFFLKEYDLSKIAAFSGGLIYMFSGFFVIRKLHPVMLFTAAWLPLILLLCEKYIKTKNKKFIFIASIIVSIQYLGGHPQIFVYCCISIFLYVIFVYFRESFPRDFKIKIYILNYLFIFAIAFLVILFQLSLNIKLVQEGLRVKLSYEAFTVYSFNKRQIPMLFFPYI